MNRKKRIESVLLKNFLGWIVEVRDISNLHKGHSDFDGNNESHFSIILNTNNQNKPNAKLRFRSKPKCYF